MTIFEEQRENEVKEEEELNEIEKLE